MAPRNSGQLCSTYSSVRSASSRAARGSSRHRSKSAPQPPEIMAIIGSRYHSFSMARTIARAGGSPRATATCSDTVDSRAIIPSGGRLPACLVAVMLPAQSPATNRATT